MTVTAVDNSRDEASKSVTVSGTAANSLGITQPSDVALMIIDAAGNPSLTIDSPSVSEGDVGSLNLNLHGDAELGQL